MDNIITINNNIVEFTNKDEQVYVSSRDVAKVFEKLHKNVIKELEKILAEQSAKIGADIVKSSYLDDLGRNYKQYLLSKKGLNLYLFNIQGYNNYKIAFLDKFEEMEQALKNNKAEFKIPTTMVEALELALEQAKHIEALNTKIENDKHKVEFYDAVADSKDAITIGDAAKVLNMGVGRNRLFQILRNNKILQSNNVPYQEYIDRGYFRVIEQQWTKPDGENCISIKTLVYQNGLDFIRKLITAKAV